MDEFNIAELDDRNRAVQQLFIDMLKDRGAIIKRFSVPLLKYCLPMYYTIIPSEAATNLARFDGVKYGAQPDYKEKEELFDYITRVRSENFGLNVKRRCTLGNFLLSSKFEDFNDKVRTGQKIRRMLIDQWNKEMEEKDIDVVVSPTTLGFEPQLQAPILSPKPSG